MSNRVISQVLGLYGGLTPSTGQYFSSGNSGTNNIQQFQRVQSVNYSQNITRQVVGQFGVLAPIARTIIDAPTVSLDFTYLLADLSNERKAGFYTSGDVSCIRDILNLSQSERTYFVAKAPEGVDNYNYTGQSQVHQITNASIASYNAQAAVGGLPSATISVQGLNFAGNTGSILQPLKAIDQTNGQVVPGRLFTIPVGITGIPDTFPVIQPGGINLTISSDPLGLLLSDIKIQSTDLKFDFSLETLQKLGSRFGFAKVPVFPVTVSQSVKANIGDFQTGDLSLIFCADTPYNITTTFADPACVGTGPTAFYYGMSGVQLDSQEFSADLSSNVSVTLNYSTLIGGPNQTNIGLFMSGRSW